MSYVLITPLKDEVENILRLKKCVLNQTTKPVAWIIVDSGSNDSTYELSCGMFQEYEWIYIIQQNEFFEKDYGHLNFSQAINEGYRELKKICLKKEIEYDYIGKTDATPLLSNDYFEILLLKMKNDVELAITCGIQRILINNKYISLEPVKNLHLTGFNDMRLYKKEFFEDINGYPLTPSPDSILLIKAIKSGWKVRVIKETSFLKTRLGGSKIGIWNGSKLKGKYMFILGYQFILAVLYALQISKNFPPHYQFLPLLWGYFLSALRREEKVKDAEIRDYYGNKRLKEVIYSLKRS